MISKPNLLKINFEQTVVEKIIEEEVIGDKCHSNVLRLYATVKNCLNYYFTAFICLFVIVYQSFQIIFLKNYLNSLN